VGNLHEDKYKFWSYLSQFFLITNVSDKFIEKIKKYILRTISVFFENRDVYDKVEKKSLAGQVTDDNCMLDT
jgi:hypothetical protein